MYKKKAYSESIIPIIKEVDVLYHETTFIEKNEALANRIWLPSNNPWRSAGRCHLGTSLVEYLLEAEMIGSDRMFATLLEEMSNQRRHNRQRPLVNVLFPFSTTSLRLSASTTKGVLSTTYDALPLFLLGVTSFLFVTDLFFLRSFHFSNQIVDTVRDV